MSTIVMRFILAINVYVKKGDLQQLGETTSLKSLSVMTLDRIFM